MLTCKVYAKSSLTQLLTACVLLLVIAESFHAQDCSQILKHGIFDVSTTSTSESLSDSFLRWLASREVKNEQDAKQLGGSVGVILPDLPVPIQLDQNFSRSSASSWGKELYERLQSNSQAHKQFSQSFSTANPNIVNAWLVCSKNKRGLVTWAESTGKPDEILLRMEARALSSSDFPKLTGLKIVKIEHSPNVKFDEATHVGSPIGTETKSIIFSRIGENKSDAANFNVITNLRDYTGVGSVEPNPILEYVSVTPTIKTNSKWSTMEFEFPKAVSLARLVSVVNGKEKLKDGPHICMLDENPANPKPLGRRWKISVMRQDIPEGQNFDFKFDFEGVAISSLPPRNSPYRCSR